MKLLSIFRVVWAVLLAVFVMSCSKEDEKPASTYTEKGSIYGKVSPVIAVEKISAYSVTDSTEYFALPNDKGEFNIYGLPVGKYNVVVKTFIGYQQPPVMYNLPVFKNVANNVGKFELERSSTLNFTVGANQYYGSNTKIASYRSGNFLNITSGKISRNGEEHKLDIFIMNYNGPGEYDFTIDTEAVTYFNSGNRKWKTVSGTMIIKPFDIAPDLLRGTFSFSAVPANDSTSGNIEIKDGVYSNIFLNNQ